MAYSIEYSIGRYQIRFNFWYLIIFLLVQTLLNELGFWQLNRAKEKQARLVQLEKGVANSIKNLAEITQEHLSQFQSVELELVPAVSKTLLLDNKINDKMPGYHVINIAQDNKSGRYVLVNRGWIFAGNDRNKMPEVELPQPEWSVSARVYPIAEESISTAKAEVEFFSGYLRLPMLDATIVRTLEAHFGKKLEPFILRLDDGTQAAFNTNWVWTNMPVEKHLAYAFQWFALAFAFLVISLVVSIKKR